MRVVFAAMLLAAIAFAAPADEPPIVAARDEPIKAEPTEEKAHDAKAQCRGRKFAAVRSLSIQAEAAQT